MSVRDVDEVIDHILAEVRLFVLCYDRAMTDSFVDSTRMTLSVSLFT